MTVAQLVTILNKVNERLYIILEDEKNNKGYAILKNRYYRDGNGWSQLILVVKSEDEQEPMMDTDWLKAILDYELNDPEYKPSFFSGEEPFVNYEVRYENTYHGSIDGEKYKIEDGKLKLYICNEDDGE